MTITAKFNSTCPSCKGQILAGDPVEWNPGEKAVHVACVGQEQTPETPKVETEEPIRSTVVRIRKWLADEKGCPVLMKGEVLRETPRAIYFKGQGHVNEVNCFICGRQLTNKWSIRMGVGPVCAEKSGFDMSHDVDGMTDEEVRELRSKHFHQEFEGWLPKSKIDEEAGE